MRSSVIVFLVQIVIEISLPLEKMQFKNQMVWHKKQIA